MKFLPLAVAISVLPLSQYVSNNRFAADQGSNRASFIFNFKYAPTFNPFEPEKKTTEPWSQNWMATAQENIRKSEYNFKWEEKLKAYCTPNRKNNLRFYYTENGFAVEPRTTKIPIGEFDPMAMPKEIKYKYIPDWKINFNLDKKQLGKGLWKVTENKAEYFTDKITVQYLNSEEGMRQNFIVHQPLSKNNQLKINFSIKTKLKDKLNGNRLQFFHKKTNVLNYEDLKVWDAGNKKLHAQFKKTGNGRYAIVVNTKNAVYPITIDPISITPAVIVESNQASARLGWAVASAGDVNGDGYSDVIAGAPYYTNGETNEGRAYIYHGSITGISTTPAAIVESNLAGVRMGTTVATAGDVNGDGYSDVIVGAPFYSNGETNEGRAYVYHGSVGGLLITPAWTIESNQVNSYYGHVVSCAGDVNGDGYSDVMVGAPYYSNGETNEGRAFVYHGSASGLSVAANWTGESNQANANYGGTQIGLIGTGISSAGDVNGDGYSDIIIAAVAYDNGETDEGRVYVYHGAASGLSLTASWTFESDQVGALLGNGVNAAGDVNGDGYGDVIVGANRYANGQTNEGRAYVFYGSVSGLSASPAWVTESDMTGAQHGSTVACLGDINSDGYADIIVGELGYSNGQSNEGAALAYFGSASGLPLTPNWTVESNLANTFLGCSVASAGDINGDGYSDVVIGAMGYTNTQAFEGAFFTYHGSAAGINTIATATIESNLANANMGYSVASAGDVNADGYIDVIVGARTYASGQSQEGAAFLFHGSATGISTTPAAIVESNQVNGLMGTSVSSAGDVNGDGYADVVVGATGYSNVQSFEGAGYIFYGSATGINTTPVILESNQASAQMGGSVASAGDVNGDGYNDVIIGVQLYDNGQTDEGAGFIYHGSATGINTAVATILESNLANTALGCDVSSAGDVNNDGFSDVILGAFRYNNVEANEGAFYVYRGSASGVNATPITMVESNISEQRFGNSVSCAGDVNGDGYSDIIVGAYYYTNGQTEEGAAFVYHGSSGGIITTPATTLEINQDFSQLGRTVASAGDVNGDGYSDVIVGADLYDNGQSDEGAAFIYLGSAAGISATASAIIESNQASAHMGYSAGSAGDVNGDGYSDIITGAYRYTNGQSFEGAAFVYHGNSPGTNKRNNLRLYNTNLTTPINSSNFLFGNFGAGLYARSFLGRDSGKIVWETRLNYNAYSGTPITNSTFFTSQQTGYTDLGLAGVELKNLVDKLLGGRYTKLRVRVKYKNTKAITGQVYGPWRNVSSIIDANNLGILPIELISFNAAWLQKGKTARLDFKTDNESGVCCFDIEKSADGFNFYSIGTLPAKNISGVQSYTFIDANATAKKQFYRIKIKGMAGQVDYSNIQQLSNDKATEILVFPNPTTDVLQLQLNKAYDNMQVRIFNASGQLVKQMIIPASNQTIPIAIGIPVQDLAAGKYWLQLQSGSEKQVLQFVKQ